MREFRISDFLSVRQLLYWRWKLWKSQYDLPEKLKALQWKLLSSLLDHCFSHVPYYRKLSAHLGLSRGDFRSLDDLSRLPVIDKFVVLDHRDEFKADNIRRFRPRELYTSGTTGTPVGFFWDINSNVLELVSQWRHFSWLGYRLGDAFLDIRSRPLNTTAGHKWNWKCRGLEFCSDHIDSSNIVRFASLVRKHRIKLWRGHPSAIADFIRLLAEAKIDDIKPEIVITASEVLYAWQKTFIESWAGVPVCDNYGQIEHVALIYQCPEGGYHICPEYGIVEILNEDGSPTRVGDEGRIVATGLHNKAFPLLRYDTTDHAIPSDRLCRCGRTLPLVEKLTGRIDDRLLSSEGKWISGLRFSFQSARGIRMAQLVQERRNALDVYLVPGTNEGRGEIERAVLEELKRRLGEAMDIRLRWVADVPFRFPGKFKFVINRLPDIDQR